MSNIKQFIKNGSISSSGCLPAYGSNSPVDMGVATKYFNHETRTFYEKNAKWSNNLFNAQMQGLDYEDFYAFKPVKLRVSDAISSVSTGDHLKDDWKMIYVADVNIDFIPIGAYVIFGGNTWITVNPDNIAPLIGTSVVRRCNVVYNTFDYYGNVESVPFSWHVGKAIATANYAETEMLLMDGYQHAAMQFNEISKNITHNTRILLGNQAYAVRGLVNFIREFTEDPKSVHYMRFDLEQTEVNENDDIEKGVADGNSFSWIVSLSGKDTMPAGTEQVLSVTSVKNGSVVQPTEEYPVSYTWESDNPSVASVSNGAVSAVSEGTATISAICDQNPDNKGSFVINVSAAAQTSFVSFTGYVPQIIEQYETATFQAAYFDNGIQTDAPITWSFDREDGTFGYAIEGNTISIECIAPSAPIVLTATCNGQSATATIELTGW